MGNYKKFLKKHITIQKYVANTIPKGFLFFMTYAE